HSVHYMLDLFVRHPRLKNDNHAVDPHRCFLTAWPLVATALPGTCQSPIQGLVAYHRKSDAVEMTWSDAFAAGVASRKNTSGFSLAH
ncbi:MAG: hypothetical protein ACKPEY_21035, partial [Planctomycetota bacterium]